MSYSMKHIVDVLKKSASDLDTLAMDIELSICDECGGECDVLEDRLGNEVHNFKECRNCGFREEC